MNYSGIPGLQAGEDVKSNLPNLVRDLKVKCENQCQRIVYLEGATSHVGGTPLSEAKREIERLRAKIDELQKDLTAVRVARSMDSRELHQANQLVTSLTSTGLKAEADLKTVSDVRDIERRNLERMSRLAKEYREALVAEQDSLRASQLETRQARAEAQQHKDYANAIFELAKSFLPLCPEKSREVWDIALEKGRALAAECRRRLIAERDAQWAGAMAPVTGSHSMTPETAAARVGVAIKEAKVSLLEDIAEILSVTGLVPCPAVWVRKQAVSLRASLNSSLVWENTRGCAIPKANETTEAATSAPAAAEKKLAELRSMMQEPHYYGRVGHTNWQFVGIGENWYLRLKRLLK